MFGAQKPAGGVSFGGGGGFNFNAPSTGFGGFGGAQSTGGGFGGFGQSAATPFGGFGQSSQAQQQTGFGGFGGFGAQSQPAFGAAPGGGGGLFGATTTGFGGFGANSQSTGGGLFGGFGAQSSAATPAFGGGLFSTGENKDAGTSGFAGFGAAPTGGMTGFGFGGQQQMQAPGTLSLPSFQPPYVAETESTASGTAGGTVATQVKYHCITAVAALKGFSLEQLHWEEYKRKNNVQLAGEVDLLSKALQAAGAAPTTTSFGATGGGLFGQPQQQSGAFAFGASAAAQPTLFGSAPTGTGFGFAAQPSSSAFTFGQPTAAVGGFGGFGATASSQAQPFGAQPFGGGFASFGKPAASAPTTGGFGGFGGGTPFGAASSSSLFGGTAAPAFGASSQATTNLFGSGTGAFGGFGASSSSGGGFSFGGAPSSQATGAFFGTGGGFGATPLSGAGATPFSGFGAQSSQAGSLFGATPAGGFGGFPAQTKPAGFTGFGNNTGGFGQPQQQPGANPFSGGGGGFFQQPAQPAANTFGATPGGFGAPQGFNTFSTAPNMGVAAQIPMSNVAPTPPQVYLQLDSPYGNNSLFFEQAKQVIEDRNKSQPAAAGGALSPSATSKAAAVIPLAFRPGAVPVRTPNRPNFRLSDRARRTPGPTPRPAANRLALIWGSEQDQQPQGSPNGTDRGTPSNFGSGGGFMMSPLSAVSPSDSPRQPVNQGSMSAAKGPTGLTSSAYNRSGLLSTPVMDITQLIVQEPAYIPGRGIVHDGGSPRMTTPQQPRFSDKGASPTPASSSALSRDPLDGHNSHHDEQGPSSSSAMNISTMSSRTSAGMMTGTIPGPMPSPSLMGGPSSASSNNSNSNESSPNGGGNYRPIFPSSSQSGQGFYTKPPREALLKYTKEQLQRVENFEIGEKRGSILFEGDTDLTYVDLALAVRFEEKAVVVYPDGDGETFCPEAGTKPEQGQKLNRPAIITLENIFPKNPADPKAGAKFLGKLKKCNADAGATFIDYLDDEGRWRFRVEHFTRYGEFGDDSDDDDDSPMATSLPVRQHGPANFELAGAGDVHMDDFSVIPPLRERVFSPADMDMHDSEYGTTTNQFNFNPPRTMPDLLIHTASRLVAQRGLDTLPLSTPDTTLQSDIMTVGLALRSARPPPNYVPRTLSKIYDRDMADARDPTSREPLKMLSRSFRVGWGPSGLLSMPGFACLRDTHIALPQTRSSNTMVLKTVRVCGDGHPAPAITPGIIPKDGFVRSQYEPLLRTLLSSATFTGLVSSRVTDETVVSVVGDGAGNGGRHTMETILSDLLTVSEKSIKSQETAVAAAAIRRPVHTSDALVLASGQPTARTVPLDLSALGLRQMHDVFLLMRALWGDIHSNAPSSRLQIGAPPSSGMDMDGVETTDISDHFSGTSLLFDDRTHMSTWTALDKRRQFDSWLRQSVSQAVAADLERCGPDTSTHAHIVPPPHLLEEIFFLLSGHQIQEASTLARKYSCKHLALLLNSASSLDGPAILNSLRMTLHQWDPSGGGHLSGNSLVTKAAMEIYRLLAGLHDGVVRTLDWKRQMGCYVWYGPLRMDTSIQLCIKHYTSKHLAIRPSKHLPPYAEKILVANGQPLHPNAQNVSLTVGTLPEPTPKPQQHRLSLPVPLEQLPEDAAYHLIRAYCEGEYFLRPGSATSLLDPLSSTYNNLDYRLSFLLLVLMGERQYIAGSVMPSYLPVAVFSEAAQHVTMAFAQQLEMEGLWEWAIFVLLYLVRPTEQLLSNTTSTAKVESAVAIQRRLRQRAIAEILARYAHDNDSPKLSFLRSELHVPDAWISDAIWLSSFSTPTLPHPFHVDWSDPKRILQPSFIAESSRTPAEEIKLPLMHLPEKGLFPLQCKDDLMKLNTIALSLLD